jgi:2-phosphoglycerate kinase
MTMAMARSWQMVLLGGASGTGKSSVGHALAVRYAVPLLEVDDLVTAVQALTTPEQQPVLHYWETTGYVAGMTSADIVALHLAVASVLRPCVEAVIANRLEEGRPVVVEGDYLTPALAASFDPRTVRAVFLHEPDVGQVVANYLLREPSSGEQSGRAEVSALLSAQWAREAGELDIPVVESRPWNTTLARVCALLDA